MLLWGFLAVVASTAVAAGVNDYPVMGILSLPASECDSVGSSQRKVQEASAVFGSPPGSSCFTSFYSQWLLSAGVRTAVIPFDADMDTLNMLLGSVNGVLFTGGELYLSPNNQSQYYQTASYIFNYTVGRNAAGDYMPLWGTCQGFQLLCMLAANADVLSRNAFDSEDVSLALNFTPAAASSRLFGSIPKDVFAILGTEPVTTNLHHDGVTPDAYEGSASLKSFFQLLSTNVDRKGKAFVSSVEAFNFPIYATQWHPERPQFDWTPTENISHTPDAIRAMGAMATFIASEVRKNSHTFPNATAEASALLFNYDFVSPGHDSYQYYFFP